jgi:hypothetical protein
MSGKQPPRWLERILLCMLPERDRHTVSGDLLEEFEEQTRVQASQLGATMWYLRQILSFVPAWLGSQAALRPLLLSLCSFTALSGLWLGAMGLRLKHPGYAEGEVISGTIVCQALLTIAALRFRRIPILRHLSGVGCLPLFWLASKALKGIIDGSNFEGYILLIALALAVQAVFTLAMIVAEQKRPKLKT